MNDDSRKLLEKSRRALRAAETLVAAGDREFAIGRAYYAMFHAAQALLWDRGLAFGKHSAVIAAFGLHFAKTRLLDPLYHVWILNSAEERERGDYGVDTDPDAAAVATQIQRARQFIVAAGNFLEGTGS